MCFLAAKRGTSQTTPLKLQNGRLPQNRGALLSCTPHKPLWGNRSFIRSSSMCFRMSAGEVEPRSRGDGLQRLVSNRKLKIKRLKVLWRRTKTSKGKGTAIEVRGRRWRSWQQSLHPRQPQCQTKSPLLRSSRKRSRVPKGSNLVLTHSTSFPRCPPAINPKGNQTKTGRTPPFLGLTLSGNQTESPDLMRTITTSHAARKALCAPDLASCPWLSPGPSKSSRIPHLSGSWAKFLLTPIWWMDLVGGRNWFQRVEFRSPPIQTTNWAENSLAPQAVSQHEASASL